jgi:hypothetical protein
LENLFIEFYKPFKKQDQQAFGRDFFSPLSAVFFIRKSDLDHNQLDYGEQIHT